VKHHFKRHTSDWRQLSYENMKYQQAKHAATNSPTKKRSANMKRNSTTITQILRRTAPKHASNSALQQYTQTKACAEQYNEIKTNHKLRHGSCLKKNGNDAPKRDNK